jgi:hypothetical protein
VSRDPARQWQQLCELFVRIRAVGLNKMRRITEPELLNTLDTEPAEFALSNIYEQGRSYYQRYIRRIYYANSHEPVGPARRGVDHRDPLNEIARPTCWRSSSTTAIFRRRVPHMWPSARLRR